MRTDAIDVATGPFTVPTKPEPPDAFLVSAARNGDAAAFGRLVERHQRSAQAACWDVLRDAHRAADAAQDAFLAAYRGLGSLRDPSAFGGWLATIARNCARRSARRIDPASPLPVALVDPRASGVPPDAGLLSAIAGLPEHERVVLTLRYFECREVADIAVVLGRPVGTITKQLSRAHDRLRRSLLAKEGHR